MKIKQAYVSERRLVILIPFIQHEIESSKRDSFKEKKKTQVSDREITSVARGPEQFKFNQNEKIEVYFEACQ